MRDLKFYNTGCEPNRGPRAVMVLARRALRRVLRPMLVRLVEIIEGLVRRLDVAEGRIDAAGGRIGVAEGRLDAAEGQIVELGQRIDTVEVYIQDLARVDHTIDAKIESRIVQLNTHAQTISGLGRRQDELDEKFQAVYALHWDHIALARRLAVIEDLLAASSASARTAIEEGEHRPLIPFPGLDEEAHSRVS